MISNRKPTHTADNLVIGDNCVSYRRTRAHDRDRTGDLFLTKEVLYRLSYVSQGLVLRVLERETGFEPATLSLEG